MSGPSLGQRLVRGLFGLWSSSYDYWALQLVPGRHLVLGPRVCLLIARAAG